MAQVSPHRQGDGLFREGLRLRQTPHPPTVLPAGMPGDH